MPATMVTNPRPQAVTVGGVTYPAFSTSTYELTNLQAGQARAHPTLLVAGAAPLGPKPRRPVTSRPLRWLFSTAVLSRVLAEPALVNKFMGDTLYVISLRNVPSIKIPPGLNCIHLHFFESVDNTDPKTGDTPATDGTLPGGVKTDTNYHVINASANTFKLSTTQAGAAVDLTRDGDGKAKKANTTPVAFTAKASDDTFRANAHGLSNGNVVTLELDPAKKKTRILTKYLAEGRVQPGDIGCYIIEDSPRPNNTWEWEMENIPAYALKAKNALHAVGAKLMVSAGLTAAGHLVEAAGDPRPVGYERAHAYVYHPAARLADKATQHADVCQVQTQHVEYEPERALGFAATAAAQSRNRRHIPVVAGLTTVGTVAEGSEHVQAPSRGQMINAASAMLPYVDGFWMNVPADPTIDGLPNYELMLQFFRHFEW